MPNPNANSKAVSVTNGKLTVTEQKVLFEGSLDQVQAKLTSLRASAAQYQSYIDSLNAQIVEYQGYETQLKAA